jgi:hypothetical protein
MSLFFGENYNFLYQKDFATISNTFNPVKNIKLTTSFEIAKRSRLSNHTNFTVFNRNHIKKNIFPNDRFDQTFYSVGLSYYPSSFPNATVNGEVKEQDIKNAPVFYLEYSEAFSSWQKNNSKYRKLKGGVMHNIRINYFNKIDYKIESGVFIGSKDKIHFADYQHFGASDLLVNLNSLFDSFMLSDNYELGTNEYWVNLSVNYSGKYVLLNHLPLFYDKPFYENLHIKILYTPNNNLYTEFGYSVSLTRVLGIGTFVSFDDITCKNIGLRFSLDLKSLADIF